MGLVSNAPLLAAWAADRLLKSSRPANLTAFARFVGTYQPDNNQPVSTVNKRGHDVLHDPLVNKVSSRQRCMLAAEACLLRCILSQGTGFPHSERERLGLRGLLPHKQLNVTTQVKPLASAAADGGLVAWCARSTPIQNLRADYVALCSWSAGWMNTRCARSHA